MLLFLKKRILMCFKSSLDNNKKCEILKSEYISLSSCVCVCVCMFVKHKLTDEELLIMPAIKRWSKMCFSTQKEWKAPFLIGKFGLEERQMCRLRHRLYTTCPFVCVCRRYFTASLCGGQPSPWRFSPCYATPLTNRIKILSFQPS